MRPNFLLALLFAAATAVSAAIPATDQVQVVEFYHSGLDHYFVSTDLKEISDLDTGVHPGWVRTGLTFQAIKPGATSAGSAAICRFYGKPEAKLDSHFYTSNATECSTMQSKFADSWVLESTEVFRGIPVDPNTGQCAAGTEAIYRLWNNRSDVNHRYTDQFSVFKAMLALGYIAEGNGSPTLPVIFCMPTSATGGSGGGGGGTTPPPPPTGSGLPNCSIAASLAAPKVGDTVTLSAACSDTPTSYAWTGCKASGSSCTATATAPGTYSYIVSATNAKGTGPTTTLNLPWTGSGGTLPICNLSSNTATPTVGGSLTLSANCSQTPTRYDWMACNYMLQSACNIIATCSSTSTSCSVTQANAGYAHYALAAANSAGVSQRAGLDVEWGGGAAPPPPPPSQPVCALYPSSNPAVIGSTIVLNAACSGNPTSFAWTGCTSSGPSCNVSSSTAGVVNYSVVGSNASGNGAPATAQVTWQLPAAPSCSLAANNPAPTVNQTITLTASCSGAPTSYAWTGCTSTSNTCSTTSGTAGAASYRVTATNAAGTGAAASTTVNWQGLPTAPPACSVAASKSNAFIGETVTLTASCSNQPSGFAWSGCSANGPTCSVTGSSAGTFSYSVTASNAVGPGAPASTQVSWTQSTAPPDFCSAFGDVMDVNEPWGGSSTYPNNYGGSFRASAVIVVSVTIPSGTGVYGKPGFSVSVAEYADPPTWRTMTLSRSRCDFRGFDPSGANGPFGIGYGTTASINSSVGPNGPLVPGQTYYVNIRNYSNDIGASCKGSTCNAIIGYQWPL